MLQYLQLKGMFSLTLIMFYQEVYLYAVIRVLLLGLPVEI